MHSTLITPSPISTQEYDVVPPVVGEICHNGRRYWLTLQSEVGHRGAIFPRQNHQSKPAENQNMVLGLWGSPSINETKLKLKTGSENNPQLITESKMLTKNTHLYLFLTRGSPSINREKLRDKEGA